MVGQPQIDVVRPALAGLRLQIRRQQYADPGAPGTEQGDSQIGGIFKMHGQTLYALGLQTGGQAQGLFAQLCVIECRCACYGTRRQGLEQ